MLQPQFYQLPNIESFYMYHIEPGGHSIEKKIDNSRIAAIMMRWQREGVIVLSALLVIIGIFAMWLGRSAVEQ